MRNNQPKTQSGGTGECGPTLAGRRSKAGGWLSRLPLKMFCTNCGSRRATAAARFCAQCGITFEVEAIAEKEKTYPKKELEQVVVYAVVDEVAPEEKPEKMQFAVVVQSQPSADPIHAQDGPTLDNVYCLCQSPLNLNGSGLGLPRLLRLQACQSWITIDARELHFPSSQNATIRLEGCCICCCTFQTQLKLIVDTSTQVDFGGVSGCQNILKHHDERSTASKARGSGPGPIKFLRVTGSGCQTHLTTLLLDPGQAIPRRNGIMGMFDDMLLG